MKEWQVAQALSRCTTNKWAVLTKLIRGQELFIWIENQQLDFIHAYFQIDGLACTNSYVVYNMMHPNDLTLIDKTIVSTYFVGIFTSWSRASPVRKKVPKGNISVSLRKVTYHHIFQSFEIFGDDVNIATKKELI